eukprot:jgi/Mesen1/2451/ME000158S01649
MRVTSDSVLVVPPFECAWLAGEGLQFQEKGSGCVKFEAQASNDVTVVFREDTTLGHYRTDASGRSYTVVLGSHRNKRLRIEVDGQHVLDVPGMAVSSQHFQHFWIDICNGSITVGRGEPGTNIAANWKDPEPNTNIQYVGLSSWDKHVGYRSIKVLPTLSSIKSLKTGDLPSFRLFWGSQQLADISLEAGEPPEELLAHSIAVSCGCPLLANDDAHSTLLSGRVVIAGADMDSLRSVLQYVYTGTTQVLPAHLAAVEALSARLGTFSLAEECQRARQEHEPSADDLDALGAVARLLGVPLDGVRLARFHATGDGSDVVLQVEGSSRQRRQRRQRRLRAHKAILSAWSAPFARMFLGGMRESQSWEVCLADVAPPAVEAMLAFMYRGELTLPPPPPPADEAEEAVPPHLLLAEVLALADRYAIGPLHQATCQKLLECVNEESACALLAAATALPGCEELQAACEEACAEHFDACSAPPAGEFRSLDAASVSRILQHPKLRVSSEEKVLDAVVVWAADRDDVASWRHACQVAREEGEGEEEEGGVGRLVRPQRVQQELESLVVQHVRFALMPLPLLHQLEESGLFRSFFPVHDLIWQAIQYLEHDCEVSSDTRRSMQALRIDGQGRLVRQKAGGGGLRLSWRQLEHQKELLYICDGDRNGVCHYAGTNYGAQPWMNPVATKRIEVTASSPPSRFTDAKLLVSGSFQGTLVAGPCVDGGAQTAWWKVDFGEGHQLMCNYYTVRQDGSANFMRSWALERIEVTASSPPSRFTDAKLLVSGSFQGTLVAGPCVDGGAQTAWWKVDFGEGHQLMCNYYTVRQDGSANFMRSWALEGSSDGERWSELRRHDHDSTLCRPGQYASWPVVGSPAFLPCRLLRVRLTGPSSDTTKPWNLCICYLEFYGYFM